MTDKQIIKKLAINPYQLWLLKKSNGIKCEDDKNNFIKKINN